VDGQNEWQDQQVLRGGVEQGDAERIYPHEQECDPRNHRGPRHCYE